MTIGPILPGFKKNRVIKG